MPKEVYAFSHIEAVIAKSASGGAFSAIAEAFFNMNSDQNKRVFGVTLDQNMEVAYEYSDSLEGCQKFKGSKYVRSNFRGVSQKIAQCLKEDYMVLFVGTPCYVYALKNKLRQWDVETDHLLCVDLICHGTPEEKYWDAYKQWLEKKEKSRLTGFLFRTHLPGKSPYAAVAEFSNGKKRIGTLETAVFNRMFLRHYTMAEGCFQCRFANLDRQGDLTIGDFWGIHEVMPEFSKGNAVSEVLVNSEKGALIAQWMRQIDKWEMKQCTNMDFIKYQNNLQRPAEKPKDYEQFKQDFQRKNFAYVVKKYAGYDLLHRLKSKLFDR